jgi:hypothetical protein
MTLPKFTSVGSYPIFYNPKHDECLCAECATEKCPENKGAVNWENADLYCDECGTRIESAYAEPEETEAEDVA